MDGKTVMDEWMIDAGMNKVDVWILQIKDGGVDADIYI